MTTNQQHWRLRVAKEFEAPINDVIKGLRADGYSIDAAAKIMSISPHTLKKHCDHHNIVFKRYQQSPGRKKHVMTKPTRSPRVLDHDGAQLTISQWADRTGINRTTIKYRIDRMGLSVAEALTLPVS